MKNLLLLLFIGISLNSFSNDEKKDTCSVEVALELEVFYNFSATINGIPADSLKGDYCCIGDIIEITVNDNLDNKKLRKYGAVIIYQSNGVSMVKELKRTKSTMSFIYIVT